MAVSGRVLSYRVYRGREGVYGFVGETTDTSFVDEGQLPDFTQPPPQGTNPFILTDGVGADVYDYPSLVTYYEGRRVFAATPLRPATIFGSQTGAPSNFDASSPAKDSDAFEWALSSARKEELRALVPSRALVALSSGAEWQVTGGGDSEQLTPSAVLARPHTHYGSSRLQPLNVGSTVLFLARDGRTVRGLDYNLNSQSYRAADLTILSQHLLKDATIVSWAWAGAPYNLVWAVRSDGALLSLTFVPEHEMWAWAIHETADGDFFERVVVVQESGRDAAYFFVRRTVDGDTVRYVERLEHRSDADCFLDSSLRYEGVAATSVSGLGHLEGREVVAVADGQVITTAADGSPLTVESGALDLAHALPDGATDILVGLAYQSTLELLDVGVNSAEIKSRQKLVRGVTFEVEASRGLWVGETEDRLTEWRQRSVGDSYGAISTATDTVPVQVSARWGVAGRAVLQQRDPLPCSVLGVTREVEVGGDR